MEEDIKLQSVEDLIKNIHAIYEENKKALIDEIKEDYIPKQVRRNKELVKYFKYHAIYEENKKALIDEIKEDYIPKQVIRDKIEEIKKSRDLANELIEHKVVIADSDSLNYGRKEAHDYDIAILQELLEENGGSNEYTNKL